MVIVLSEPWEQLQPSASVRDIRLSMESAGRVGCRIFSIPTDFDQCGSADNALAHVPEFSDPVPGIWIGYIPDPERYDAIYTAASRKRVVLPNDPAQHLMAMELDRSLPLLSGLTPKSIVLSERDDWKAAVSTLGYPVFVKGVVQSRKSRGIAACVAHSDAELERLIRPYWELYSRSRGRVVVRTFVQLRHERTTAGDFPVGREFRVFLYRGRVLAMGYYWEGSDSLSVLSTTETTDVVRLARNVWERTGIPYLAVDIGQLIDGSWIVVEIGDGQFAGLSQVSPLKLWNAIHESFTIC